MYWVMCVQGCFLLSFVIQSCAFVAVERNGEGWRLKMELDFHTCHNELSTAACVSSAVIVCVFRGGGAGGGSAPPCATSDKFNML